MPDRSATRFLLPSGLTFLFLSISLLQSHFKLLTVAELTPHWWSFASLSHHSEVVRLPSLLAIGLGLFSLWKTLRYSQALSTICCLILLSTRVFDYAYDASPIALFSGLALIAIAIAVRFVKPKPLIFPRRTIILVILLLTTWVTVRQACCAMLLRRQRHAFFQLRDQVERATAPGEQVLVDDDELLLPLFWYASPALKQALTTPTAPISPQTEFLYIGLPNSWPAHTLAMQHFTFTEDLTTVHWNDLGGVYAPMAQPTTRLYFVTPSAAFAR